MRGFRSGSILLALALAGCATAPPAPLAGSWGGRGVSLVLESQGGRLEYDCAAGTIDGPLVPGAAGRFAAGGTHTPGLGGPVQVDRPPQAFPARYSGSVSGDTMRLTVEVPARDLRIGPLTLRRGAEPQLLRCL